MADELVLNPITGRYIRKYGPKWQKLVTDGLIAGEATIPANRPAPRENRGLEPIERRFDKALLNETAALAVKNKDSLKGLSKVEAEELLQSYLYERLMANKPTGPSHAGLDRTPHDQARFGRDNLGITRSIAIPIRRHKPPSNPKRIFLSTADDTADETDFSVGSSQLEETEDD